MWCLWAPSLLCSRPRAASVFGRKQPVDSCGARLGERRACGAGVPSAQCLFGPDSGLVSHWAALDGDCVSLHMERAGVFANLLCAMKTAWLVRLQKFAMGVLQQTIPSRGARCVVPAHCFSGHVVGMWSACGRMATLEWSLDLLMGCFSGTDERGPISIATITDPHLPPRSRGVSWTTSPTSRIHSSCPGLLSPERSCSPARLYRRVENSLLQAALSGGLFQR